MPVPPLFRSLPHILAVSIGYYVAGKLGVLLAMTEGGASMIFPPTGLAVAAVLFLRRPGMLGVFLGAMLLHLELSLQSSADIDWLRGTVIGLAGVLQASVGAYLLRRFDSGFHLGEYSGSGLLRFLQLSLLFCLVSSSISVSYLVYSGVFDSAGFWETWLTWWLGDAMGVILFFPVASLLLNRSAPDAWQRLKVIVPILSLLMTVIVFLQFYTNNLTQEEIRLKYQPQAENVWRSIENMHVANTELLASVARTITLFPGMDFNKFQSLALAALDDHPYLHALSLNHVVSDLLRFDYETWVDQNPELAGFEIRDKDSGMLQTAAARDLYVAVSFIAPLERNQNAVGFDIASNPIRLESIKAAAATGESVATPPIKLVQEEATKLGYLQLYPFFMHNTFTQGHNDWTGDYNAFVVGVLRIEDMISSVITGDFEKNFDVYLFDPELEAQQSLLFSTGDETSVHDDQDDLLIWQRTIEFGNRRWVIDIHAKPAIFFENISHAATFISLLSLLIAALIQFTLLILLDQARVTKVQVVEKTRQITEQKNKQEQLFAIIGHELRTPASAMQMLMEQEKISDRFPRGKVLMEMNSHLLNVLDDMRVVINPERAIEGKKIKTSVRSVVNLAIEAEEHLLLESKLSVSLHADKSTEVLCDFNAQLLRQITLNLIKNAALHAEASALDIYLETTNLSAQTVSYELRFVDNGKGIASAARAQLFDAFVRGNHHVDGSGLGLHLSRRFAREHLMGDLTFQPAEEKGAVFTLTITLPIADQSTDAVTESCISSLQGWTILLVEDNDLLRKISAELLADAGAEVIQAANGKEALTLFAANRTDVDLVLTDIFMPEMDGYALVRSLREQQFNKLVIGITAATVGQEISQMHEAGADEVVSKPVSLPKLYEILARES